MRMIRQDAKALRKFGQFPIKECVNIAANDLAASIAEEKQIERDNDDWEHELDQMGYDN